MSGTWPTARAAIAAHLNGATATASGGPEETLAFYEYIVPPQDAYPYGYVMPAPMSANRLPGSMREELYDVICRVMLSPLGEDDLERLHIRFDAWREALLDSWDSAIKIDDTADVSAAQDFSELDRYDDLDQGWGFEMVLARVRITREKTFTP